MSYIFNLKRKYSQGKFKVNLYYSGFGENLFKKFVETGSPISFLIYAVVDVLSFSLFSLADYLQVTLTRTKKIKFEELLLKTNTANPVLLEALNKSMKL